MEFALPMFALVVFVLAAGIFALVVALAIVWIARRLRRSWLFSISAGLVWLIGFSGLFAVALLSARYVALAVLDPLVHQHTPRSEVVGIYEARYEGIDVVGGLEILVLNSDGTYQQTYVRRNGELSTNTGKWSHRDDREFGTQVDLEGVLSPAEDTSFNKGVPKEDISTGVQSLFGRITLPLDPDMGYRYTKVMGLSGTSDNSLRTSDE